MKLKLHWIIYILMNHNPFIMTHIPLRKKPNKDSCINFFRQYNETKKSLLFVKK